MNRPVLFAFAAAIVVVACICPITHAELTLVDGAPDAVRANSRSANLVDASALQTIDGFRPCVSSVSKPPIATVLGVQVSPAIASWGSHVSVTISFSTPQRITNGKVQTSFLFGTIELGTDTSDLCAMLASSTPVSHCPLASGTYTLSHGFVVPQDVPPNKYSIRVSIVSLAGETLTCFVTSVRVAAN